MESESIIEQGEASYSIPSKDLDQKTISKQQPQARKHALSHDAIKNSTESSIKIQSETQKPAKQRIIGPFNTHNDKVQILTDYISGGINNFYRKYSDFEEVTFPPGLSTQDEINLLETFATKTEQSPGDQFYGEELVSYLSLIQEIKSAGQNFDLLSNEADQTYYCRLRIQKGEKWIEVSRKQKQILESRHEFRKKYQQSLTAFNNKHSHKRSKGLSELSFQMTFFCYFFNNSRKSLRQSITKLERRIVETISEEKDELPDENSFDYYIAFMIRNRVQNALKDQQIDYLNFFRDNEIEEHNLELHRRIKTTAQFEEFMKNKKNSKINSKSVLHTGCLACLSYYNEKSNPLLHCKDCGVRFHKHCYPSILYQSKVLLCRPCFKKKTQRLPTNRKQCNFCGTRGLLSLQLDQKTPSHLFCLVLNAPWQIINEKIVYLEPPQKPTNKLSAKTKCGICKVANIYCKKCVDCENYLHPCCAFLAGHQIQADFASGMNCPDSVRIKCCDEQKRKEERARMRKFIINYQKQSFKKMG